MSNLTVSSSPHIRQNTSTQRIMLDVIIALCPAFIASIIIFGVRAAIVTVFSVVCCVFLEFIWEFLMHKKITITMNLSSLIAKDCLNQYCKIKEECFVCFVCY